jgi:hypothetical protein
MNGIDSVSTLVMNVSRSGAAVEPEPSLNFEETGSFEIDMPSNRTQGPSRCAIVFLGEISVYVKKGLSVEKGDEKLRELRCTSLTLWCV